LYSFGSALEHFGEEKVFLFFIFPGFRSCIDPLVVVLLFEDGMKTLVEQGFSQAEVLAVLNGKGSNQIVPI
jgi:hypothetical protein